MTCRILSYYDLYRFREEDSLNFEINEKVFKNLSDMNSIITLDESIRDISFQNSTSSITSNHQKLKSVNIHTCLLNSQGFPFSKKFKRGVVSTIELLEDITISSNNVFRSVKLNDFLQKEGFVISQSTFLPANTQLPTVAIVYLGDKSSYSLENYVHIFTYEFFLLN